MTSNQEIEVTFAPTPTGTRLTLTHSGWALGEPREMYDSGWDFVLGRLVG